MKRRHLNALILMIVMTACSTNYPKSITPESTIQSTPINTNSPIDQSPTSTQTIIPITAQHTSTPVLSIPSLTPTPEIVTPQVIQICPEQQEVGLDELGLGENTRILLISYDEEVNNFNKGVWILSANDPKPLLILNTIAKPGWHMGYTGTSPNGQWLLLYRWREGDYQHITFWVSSLDGKRQWDVYTTKFYHEWLRWYYDREIVLSGQIEGREGSGLGGSPESIPIAQIDPFTLDIKPLTPLPDRAVLYGYFTGGENSYSVYGIGLTPFQKFVLYNYTQKISIPVLNWLVDKDWVNFSNTNVSVSDEGLFTVHVERPYGIDLAFDLKPEFVSQPNLYEKVMKSIHFSDQGIRHVFLWRIPHTNLFKYDGVEYENAKNNGNTKTIQVLDYSTMVMRSYCLKETSTVVSEPSSDGRLLALTYHEPLDSNLPAYYAREINVLNLETGQYSHLTGYSVVGWGAGP